MLGLTPLEDEGGMSHRGIQRFVKSRGNLGLGRIAFEGQNQLFTSGIAGGVCDDTVIEEGEQITDFYLFKLDLQGAGWAIGVLIPTVCKG